MESTALESMKFLLLGLMREREQPQRHRDEIAVENAPDTLDRVQREAERDLAIRQIQSDFDRLQSIRLALQRIDDGTYGTCLRCEESISSKRLNVVPWASFCIKCQEIADRENQEDGDEKVLSAR